MTDYVAFGPIKRRVEVTGEIEHAHERLRKWLADLESLDAIVLTFAPDFQVEAIKPKAGRAVAAGHRKGMMTRHTAEHGLDMARQRESGSVVSKQPELRQDLGKLEIQVAPLFPTPVATAQLPEADRINAALKRLILEREAAQASTQHSNLGGWQSTWDFIDWGGPALQAVLKAGETLANRLTTDRQGRSARVEWKINCWANVNRKGHGNEFHTHPGAYWSGVYYVDDGGAGADSSLGGQLEIQDPRGVAPVMYAPLLAFAGPGGQALGAREMLQPRAGMMVMFPSWVQHGVRPYHGDGDRISVAFNLSV